jgi:hypothetical protein
MRKNWRWPAAGLLGLVVAVSLSVIPAIGQDTVFGEVGTLRLLTDDVDGDRLVYDPVAADEPVLTQVLSQTNCKLASSGDSLMSFVGSSSFPIKKPAAGLREHRIGVVQLLEQHELCARIDGIIGQRLTVGLTGSLAESDIGYAEIDLGFKHNGSAILELRNDGALVSTVTVTCSSPAPDCGPDSGGENNRRVILWTNPDDNPGDPPTPGQWQAFQVAVFDTIVIKPGSKSLKSSISLEAGYHGSPAGPIATAGETLFTIVEPFEGEIGCNATVNLGGGQATTQITRGSNADGSTCEDGGKGPLLFNFESGVEGEELFVDFIIEPVEGATQAQFLEVITWTFEDPPNVDAEEPQHATLSYDDHVGAERRVMPWCLIDPRVEGGLPAPLDPATVLPPAPEGEPPHTSCLIESNERVTWDGNLVKVDFVYNVADGKRWS